MRLFVNFFTKLETSLLYKYALCTLQYEWKEAHLSR